MWLRVCSFQLRLPFFWFKKHSKLNGLTVSNELISHDEALRTKFVVALHGLYRTLVHMRPFVRSFLTRSVWNGPLASKSIYQTTNDGFADLTQTDMFNYVGVVANGLANMYGIGHVDFEEDTCTERQLPEHMQYMDMIGVDKKQFF